MQGKLTTVTRGDISNGYKAVQSTHAAINFIFENYGRASPCWKESNTLIQLEAKDEDHLKRLVRECQKKGVCHTVFREPDIGNQITSIALEPSATTRKLVAHLPLLLKDK